MKTKEGMPMPGAKRANQNQPSGDKEKNPLVLPKVDKASRGKTAHEAHTILTKSKGIKK